MDRKIEKINKKLQLDLKGIITEIENKINSTRSRFKDIFKNEARIFKFECQTRENTRFDVWGRRTTKRKD